MSYNSIVVALNVDSILIQREVLNGGNFYFMMALKSKFPQYSIAWRRISIRASQISVYLFNNLLRLTTNNALMFSPTGFRKGNQSDCLHKASIVWKGFHVMMSSFCQIESCGLPTLTADRIRILPGQRLKGVTCQIMNIKVSNFNQTLAYQQRFRWSSAGHFPDQFISSDLGIKWLISFIISNSRGIQSLNIKRFTRLQTGHHCPAWSVNYLKDSYIAEH